MEVQDHQGPGRTPSAHLPPLRSLPLPNQATLALHPGPKPASPPPAAAMTPPDYTFLTPSRTQRGPLNPKQQARILYRRAARQHLPPLSRQPYPHGSACPRHPREPSRRFPAAERIATMEKKTEPSTAKAAADDAARRPGSEDALDARGTGPEDLVEGGVDEEVEAGWVLVDGGGGEGAIGKRDTAVGWLAGAWGELVGAQGELGGSS